MGIEFAKMHGAGNDFVVVADRAPDDSETIRRLCDRRFGVGADGALWLDRRAGLGVDFRLHLFNSDGSRVVTCINGFRCAARRAVELGWAERIVTFRTDRDEIRAAVDQRQVAVWVPPPQPMAGPIKLPEGSPASTGCPVFTGEPHLVVELPPAAMSALDDTAFDLAARKLRWWRDFFDRGSNVHFVSREDDHIRIRSFERGVEAETLACGSGCLAAVSALGLGGGSRTVRLLTHSGVTLKVVPDGPQWTVRGPAHTVFVGEATV